jgi:hypothetical protein
MLGEEGIELTPVTLNNGTIQETYAKAPSQNPAPASSGAAASGQADDSVQLSPAALREVALTGRVAMNSEAGNLTSDQAQQLYGQISSIHQQIVADLQAGGGTLSTTDAQAIRQAQNQLSQTIYSDAHNGATPPSDPDVTRAGARQALQAGRIVLDEKAGKLSSAQAQQLGFELAATQQQIAADKQANGGSLSPPDAQAINQLQNQVSRQIYEAAHGGAAPDQSVENPV